MKRKNRGLFPVALLVLIVTILVLSLLRVPSGQQPTQNLATSPILSSDQSTGSGVTLEEEVYAADKFVQETFFESPDDQATTPDLQGVQRVLPVNNTSFAAEFRAGFVEITLKREDSVLFVERFLQQFRLSLSHPQVKVK